MPLKFYFTIGDAKFDHLVKAVLQSMYSPDVSTQFIINIQSISDIFKCDEYIISQYHSFNDFCIN